MSTEEDEGGPRADASRDADRSYDDRTTQLFGGDGSYGFSNSLDGAGSKPTPRASASGSPKSLFGGQTPFANMPVYTPVTRAAEAPPAPEPAPRSYARETERPAETYRETPSYRESASSFRDTASSFRSTSAQTGFGDTASSFRDTPSPYRESASLAGPSGYDDGSTDAWGAQDAFDTQDPFAGSSLFGSDSPFTSQPAAPTPSSRRDTAFGFDNVPEQAYDPYADRAGQSASSGVALSSLRAHSEPRPQQPEPRSYGEPYRAAPAEAPRQPADTRKAVQTFEAGYDQHPEVPLGFSTSSRPRHEASFDEEDEGVDADFLDEPRSTVVSRGRALMTRKVGMIAASLGGAVLLGGTIAYIYQGSGGTVGDPPVIQADNRPVKVEPKEVGGKEFPHKNKQIYDRLQGDEPTGDEQIVPREEAVAPEATAPAEEEQAPEMAAPAFGGEEEQVAAADTDVAAPPPAASPSAQSDGSRRVKTMVVRPDGTIVQPAMAAAGPGSPGIAPAGANAGFEDASSEQVAAIPSPPLPATKPATKPRATAKQDVAAIAPAQTQATPAAATPGAGTGQYVVQVAARKSQTEALAAFADMQQKYPQLLSGYRPMVQKADLGQRGTWYRLRVGPMGQKTAATKLCDQLRSAGLNSCLVMTE